MSSLRQCALKVSIRRRHYSGIALDRHVLEVDSQVSKIHKRLAATLEIHERLAALEALTDYQLAVKPEPFNLESLRR